MFRITCAITEDQFLAAGRLIYNNYLGCDLIPENSQQVYLSPWAKLSDSCVVLGYHDEELIYTLTIVPDSRWGLPSDGEFPDELNRLRQMYPRLGELSCFAGKYVSLRLFNLFCGAIYNLLIKMKLTPVLVCHPRHAKYYAQIWGFREMTYRERISRVNYHPGVLMYSEPIFIPESSKKYLEEANKAVDWDSFRIDR